MEQNGTDGTGAIFRGFFVFCSGWLGSIWTGFSPTPSPPLKGGTGGGGRKRPASGYRAKGESVERMAVLSDAEQVAAKRNWALMDADMRKFVTELVARGLMDGRAGLAASRVAVLPDRLPRDPGAVRPCIVTAAERKAMDAIRARGGRA